MVEGNGRGDVWLIDWLYKQNTASWFLCMSVKANKLALHISIWLIYGVLESNTLQSQRQDKKKKKKKKLILRWFYLLEEKKKNNKNYIKNFIWCWCDVMRLLKTTDENSIHSLIISDSFRIQRLCSAAIHKSINDDLYVVQYIVISGQMKVKYPIYMEGQWSSELDRQIGTKKEKEKKKRVVLIDWLVGCWSS